MGDPGKCQCGRTGFSHFLFHYTFSVPSVNLARRGPLATPRFATPLPPLEPTPFPWDCGIHQYCHDPGGDPVVRVGNTRPLSQPKGNPWAAKVAYFFPHDPHVPPCPLRILTGPPPPARPGVPRREPKSVICIYYYIPTRVFLHSIKSPTRSRSVPASLAIFSGCL